MTTRPPPSELASLAHLQQIEAKLERLQMAGMGAVEQIASQVNREPLAWCPCRVTDAVAGLTATWQDRISDALGMAGIDHMRALAEPCACQELWLSGAFPIDVQLPARPGVYICFDEDDRAAYIGTSKNDVKKRLQRHFRDPDKPRLARWSAFFPGRFGESAAVWEIRLIEEHQPYLNREHADGAEVDWEPQGYRPPGRGPWYDRDQDYQWFRTGPGRLLDLSDNEPWEVAGHIRKLVDEGVTRDQIRDACGITAAKNPASHAAYMSAVARNLLRESAGG